MNLSDFNSAKKFSTPRKMTLALPDGTPSTETLSVLGYYHPAVMAARAKYRRALVETDKEDPAKDAEARLDFLGETVVGWSFVQDAPVSDGSSDTKIPVPFDTATFKAWLHDCPHVADDLDRFVYDRKGFLDAAV